MHNIINIHNLIWFIYMIYTVREKTKCSQSIFNILPNKVTSSGFCADRIITGAENSAGGVVPIM